VLSVDPALVKSHAQLDGDPVLVSVKLTVSGCTPLSGVPVKFATGGEGGGAVSLNATPGPIVIPEPIIIKKLPIIKYLCNNHLKKHSVV
jgi:hypothetical protein